MNNYFIYKVMREHKDEILKDGDWWWGFNTHSVNVHCLDDDNYKNDNAVFSINVYAVGENGMDDYSVQYDLRPMTKRELRAL